MGINIFKGKYITGYSKCTIGKYIIRYSNCSYGEVYRLIYGRKSRFTAPLTYYSLNIHLTNTTEITTKHYLFIHGTCSSFESHTCFKGCYNLFQIYHAVFQTILSS